MEGNLHFKIDWASLIVGRKFTDFGLFYFVFEGNFQVQAPRGLYLEGQFNGGVLRYELGGLILYLEGLIHGGAYFQNFTVTHHIVVHHLFCSYCTHCLSQLLSKNYLSIHAIISL